MVNKDNGKNKYGEIKIFRRNDLSIVFLNRRFVSSELFMIFLFGDDE